MPKENNIITFTKAKETKNTVKFEEDAIDGSAPVVGTLYVQKWFAGATQKLQVTVEAVA